jgi:hypothetical protein
MEQTTNETTKTTYWYGLRQCFLPIALRDVYEENNSWPADSKPIPMSFTRNIRHLHQKEKSGCDSGLPAWVEHDSKIDPVDYAAAKKKKLLTLATNAVDRAGCR